MLFVATLISDPRLAALSDALVARARQALLPLHMSPVGLTADACVPAWLALGIAVDLHFAHPDEAGAAGQAEQALRTAIGPAPVDIIVQPAATRRKRLFLADMDSTMIGQECIDELADFAGLKDRVSAITERAMRGEITFEPALRERVALLRGLPVSIVDEIVASRITLTPGGATLVATMQAQGGYTALVSGGFTLFTGPIGRMIGFNEDRSNRLLVADGVLLGGVEEPILGRQAKLDALVELRTRLQLEPHETLAVGDGANDLAMLGEAGLGVAFRAKPAVAAAAHARLDHADLTGLLYAQGYAAAEFVTG